MHGREAVIEEILDWRPYDYVTDRTIIETTTGPLKSLHTIEFEPVPSGTVVHMRFAAPKTKREQALMAHIGPEYGTALQSAIPSLVAQLEAAFAARDAGRPPEPELAAPKPDGPLAGLKPPQRDPEPSRTLPASPQPASGRTGSRHERVRPCSP